MPAPVGPVRKGRTDKMSRLQNHAIYARLLALAGAFAFGTIAR